MSFKTGKNYRVLITTENVTGSILCTGSPVATTTSGYGPNSATKGIAMLGEVDSVLDTSSEIKNLEGIDPTWAWEDDPFKVFGQSRDLDNPIRKTWEITLTKKGEDKLFAKLVDAARFGVTGSAPALFDGLDTYPDDTGFRVYVWDGESFYVGYHGTIAGDGYKETLGPTSVTVQALTIKGGIWSASVAPSSSGMTATMDITQ